MIHHSTAKSVHFPSGSIISGCGGGMCLERARAFRFTISIQSDEVAQAGSTSRPFEISYEYKVESLNIFF